MKQYNWQKIYQKHSPKLLGICRRYVSDIFAAEDIIHDSFIIAIQKNGQLKDEKALFSWLKTIVVNNALQYIRKQSKETLFNTETSEIPDNHAEMEHHFLEEKNIFIYDFTQEELLLSIDQLPSHHKSVFNLYFIENYSHAEISKTLGITINTSKSHLLRAKKSIREFLLTTIVNENTPKNKIAQIIIFFGLGSLLWAKNFQSKFADFTIQPEKKLDIPKDISQGKISVSNQILIKKIAVAASFFILFFTYILAFNPLNIFWLKSDKSLTKNHQNNETATFGVDNSKVKVESSQNQHKSIIKNQKNIEENLNICPDKIKIDDKSLSLKSNQSKKNIKKDTISEEVHQVIVVKKIITRDTIFVEK